MNIKNIITSIALTVCVALIQTTLAQPTQQSTRKKNVKPAAAPTYVVSQPACPNGGNYVDACAAADRAERRRIDEWQDPLLAEQLQAEADFERAACLRQNPNYTFPEERLLPQQEMPHVD